MDWPPDGTDWNRRYLLWQTQHDKPIAYGVNTTFPDAARHDQVLWGSFLRLTDPDGPLKNRDIPGRRPRQSTQTAQISNQGFSSLVLHGAALNTGDRNNMLRTLTQAYGPPIHTDGQTYGWLLNSEAD
jgi:hypothetical protein